MIQFKEQSKFLTLTGLGVALIVIGVALFILGAMGDARVDPESNMSARWIRVVVFPVGLGVVGFALCMWALVFGLKIGFGRDDKAPVKVVRGASIIAAFIDSKEGRVFDPDMFDPADLWYFVHVHLPTGEKLEFKTSESVFSTLGEGLKGTVTYQGKWLGKFEREILAPDEQPRSYVP